MGLFTKRSTSGGHKGGSHRARALVSLGAHDSAVARGVQPVLEHAVREWALIPAHARAVLQAQQATKVQLHTLFICLRLCNPFTYMDKNLLLRDILTAIPGSLIAWCQALVEEAPVC